MEKSQKRNRVGSLTLIESEGNWLIVEQTSRWIYQQYANQRQQTETNYYYSRNTIDPDHGFVIDHTPKETCNHTQRYPPDTGSEKNTQHHTARGQVVIRLVGYNTKTCENRSERNDGYWIG